MGGRKKTRILWDRVFIAAFILILLIILIVSGFNKIFSNASDDSSEKDSTASSVLDDSSVSGNTYNANYDYLEYDNSKIFEGNLILINNTIPYTMNEPTDCVSVYENKTSDYYVKDTTVYLKPEVINALNTMTADFVAATGEKNLMVISGYRTKARQQELYDAELAKTNETVSTLVAMAGYSEHHTGLAVDFGVYPAGGVYKTYDGTGNFSWINENCHKYGFIVRYNADKVDITGIDNEPWHFRYVGKVHAIAMHELGLCYEEYMEYLKPFEFEKVHCTVQTADGEEHGIYYVPTGRLLTVVPVPKNSSYSVSGNNTDGFIVTMRTK